MSDRNRTLHVRIASTEETRTDLRERVRALERGEETDEMLVLNLHDEADLARIVRPTNLELLRTIARREPRSMREVASMVGRDYKEVHRNLTELADLDVIRFEETGRSKRPVVEFDDIEVEIPVSAEPGETDTVSV